MYSYPRFPALMGRRALWLREYGDTSERSTPAIIRTMQTYGYDCLALKVMDGLRYQQENDPLTPLGSLTNIEALRDELAAAGIAFLPVVVPRGLAGEAEKHGAIAALCGCLMTDIEPYAGFWDQAPVRLIPVYAQYLRRAAGDAYLINEPDPRQSGYADGHVAECAQWFDAIAAQHYVGWASIGWSDVAAEVHLYDATRAGYADAYATLYGVERTDLAAQFWRAITGTSLGFCAFAMGPMNAAELTLFGQQPLSVEADPIPGTLPQPAPVPEPPTPVPTPPTPIDAEWELRIGLAAALSDGVSALLNTTLSGATACQDARACAQDVVDAVNKL